MSASKNSGAGAGDRLQGPYTATALVDGQGGISLWSPRAESLLGYPAEEVCGTPAVDLLATSEAREAAVAAWKRHATRQGWDGVLDVRHRDGREVQVALSVRPVLGSVGHAGWLVSAADAGQVEQVELDHAILDALFSQAPISISVFDTELRFLAANAVTVRDLGLAAEQIIGRRLGDVASDVDAPAQELIMRRVRDTGEPVIDFKVKARVAANMERYGVWSASSYRLTGPRGRILGVCHTYVDITDGYRAQRRLALLTEASAHIGTTLDVLRTAQELADTAVPNLADLVTVDLLEAVLLGEEPDVPGTLRRSGRAVRAGGPETAYAVGETVAISPNTPQTRCLVDSQPVLIGKLGADEWAALDPRIAEKFRGARFHSLMVVPLRARGVTLGVATFSRYLDPAPYDEGDLALAEDFCSRAAVCIDNARRYTREHTIALALQSSLLPHHLPDYPAVEAAYWYLPAAAHAEAGGDWFDVLPLSGARVALVVGDVMGHSLHAAAIMGRLRTAVHTLADLDFDPDEVLTQLDDLVIRLAEEDPDCEGATCLYAVYDPISRRCSFARAGHPPPVLVRPDGAVEVLHDIPAGPPLGLGGLPFETAEYQLAEGSLLALYTDGLIKAPGRDVDVELDRLTRVLAGPGRPLEQVGEVIMSSSLAVERRSDDVALLLTRTRVLATERVASWDLPVDPAQVAQARALTARQLAAWGLDHAAFTSELIVSELVTNAIRHARGPVTLRLIHAAALICEVSDSSLSAPHLRRARMTEEGGRGLFLVAQLAARWGTRYHRDGKTIWAEQLLSAVPSY
ncbi:SpoIIE family protein phosphatase [Streptomyces spiralis]|uniref:SpoIIE family protein phosphatase n=1 Tax=Streptomyces spiralis TaxID=66376 RepID=UPI003409A2D6